MRVGPIYERIEDAEERVESLEQEDIEDGDFECHEYQIEPTDIINGVFIVRAKNI